MTQIATISEFRKIFYFRMTEWAFALMMFLWGVILVVAEPYDQPGFAAFRHVVEEDRLGWLLVLGGMIRLIALVVNGAFRPMYYVRAVMALASMMTWMLVSIGFASGVGLSVWAAVYPIIALFEGANAIRAAVDAGQAEKAARNAGLIADGAGPNGTLQPTA